MPLPSNPDRASINQWLTAVANAAGQDARVVISEFRRRFGMLPSLSSDTWANRDEWSELLLQGRCFHFGGTQGAVAGQQFVLELGNGATSPTGSVLLVKRITVGTSPAIADFSASMVNNAVYDAGLTNIPSVLARYPTLTDNQGVSPQGSFPLNPSVVAKGPTVRAGTLVTPAAGEVIGRLLAPGAGPSVVFEVPGGWFEAIWDRNSSGDQNVNFLEVICSVPNQAVWWAVDAALVPLSYF